MSAEFPHVEGVTHRFIDAGGLRTHVAEAGQPDGDPYLLLHGWPQHWYEWRHLIGPLAARGNHVICPDLRGLGWTDAPPHGYEKEQLASDVLALMDSMGLERVRLVGHDWGGWVGYLLCLRAPERVERFLALNIFPPFVEPRLRTVLSAWRLWYQWVVAAPFIGERAVANLGGHGERVYAWLGVGREAWSEAERESFLGQFRDPARARASVQYYRSFQLRELPPLIAGRYRGVRLRTPTLLLFGTGDRVQDTRALEGVERHADDLTVELVEGCGHFIADQRPELVAERAQSFFG